MIVRGTAIGGKLALSGDAFGHEAEHPGSGRIEMRVSNREIVGLQPLATQRDCRPR